MRDFTLRLHWHGPDRVSGPFPTHLDEPFQVGGFAARLSAPQAGRALDRERGLIGILKGILYSHSLDAALDLYARSGDAFADELEGAFALLLLDLRRGRVLVVTDRVGSQQVYAARDGACVVLSSTLDLPELFSRPLSPAGVACSLVNGVMLNGLTLYQGVRALESASVHEVGADHTQRMVYWPHRPTDQPTHGQLADHRAELADLLRAAVDRRVQALGQNVFLSLSGGYDSRGLLSLLASSGRSFQTFSYTLDPQGAGNDASVARQLAAQYGVRHRVLTAYRGDLLATLRRNARWGQGTAHFSDEADAWAEFEGWQPDDVFAGDEMFEWDLGPVASRAELLRRVLTADFSPLDWLSGQLPSFTALRDAWHSELDGLLSKADGWPQRDHPVIVLALQQFLPYHLLPWRSHFTGHAAQVHTPYLDGAVLDFFQRVPVNLFQDKLIFRETLRALDPALLQVPLARSLGYTASWTRELVRQRGAVLATLDVPSRLDDLIDPGLLRSLLTGLSEAAPGSGVRQQVRQSLGQLRHSPLGRRLFGQPNRGAPSVSATTFLLRALTLRELDISQRHGEAGQAAAQDTASVA